MRACNGRPPGRADGSPQRDASATSRSRCGTVVAWNRARFRFAFNSSSGNARIDVRTRWPDNQEPRWDPSAILWWRRSSPPGDASAAPAIPADGIDRRPRSSRTGFSVGHVTRRWHRYETARRLHLGLLGVGQRRPGAGESRRCARADARVQAAAVRGHPPQSLRAGVGISRPRLRGAGGTCAVRLDAEAREPALPDRRDGATRRDGGTGSAGRAGFRVEGTAARNLLLRMRKPEPGGRLPSLPRAQGAAPGGEARAGTAYRAGMAGDR